MDAFTTLLYSRVFVVISLALAPQFVVPKAYANAAMPEVGEADANRAVLPPNRIVISRRTPYEFIAVDTNRDDEITRQEYQVAYDSKQMVATPVQFFTLYDLNTDNRVDLIEYRVTQPKH